MASNRARGPYGRLGGAPAVGSVPCDAESKGTNRGCSRRRTYVATVMTRAETDDVRTVFAACMKRAGVERKGSVWYVRTQEAIFILDLQASPYGPACYCNVGVWLTALDRGHERYPKPRGAHITDRTETMFPADAKVVAALLDAEAQMSEDQRREGLFAFVTHQLVPLCESVATVRELRELLNEGGPLQHAQYPSAPAVELLTANGWPVAR